VHGAVVVGLLWGGAVHGAVAIGLLRVALAEGRAGCCAPLCSKGEKWLGGCRGGWPDLLFLLFLS
jgi:hypothetical protein